MAGMLGHAGRTKPLSAAKGAVGTAPEAMSSAYPGSWKNQFAHSTTAAPAISAR